MLPTAAISTSVRTRPGWRRRGGVLDEGGGGGSRETVRPPREEAMSRLAIRGKRQVNTCRNNGMTGLNQQDDVTWSAA